MFQVYEYEKKTNFVSEFGVYNGIDSITTKDG